jgi:16S rRNA U1498 N3-methylase RsmE
MQKASELSGVPYELVRQWESRRKRRAIKKAVEAGVTVSQSPVTIVAERIQDTLAEHERETRLSLARYARRAAKDAEQASLRDAPLVHKAAQVAGIVHKWDSEKSNQTFTLNVLNINSLDNRLGDGETVIDAQP